MFLVRFERALAVAVLAMVPGFALAAPSETASTSAVALVAEQMNWPSDDVIAAKLKSSLSAVLEKGAMLPAERKAAEAFYARRDFSPIWIHNGRVTAAGKAATARLKNAAADGLDPADYRVSDFARLGSPDALAIADVELTGALLRFTRHLATGRIAPHRVTAEVEYGDHTPDPGGILKTLTAVSDIDAAIESYNPPHAGFRALKAKLIALRASTQTGSKSTRAVDTIAANMERWRWLPRDLGRTYVLVNIPDFTLKVVHGDRPVWSTKIVAGKPQTPTPLLTAKMSTIVVNPSWHVPASIIQNELLPRYGSDPNIFSRMGLEVKRGTDGGMTVVQPPGAANALGRIKFAFPNKFQVYLHDTPDKKLFAHARRAFSHGCMRVEDPAKFGEVLLSLAMSNSAPNQHQITRMFGHEERPLYLEKAPMVHLTYQTAFVDDHGKLKLDEDLYGFDARMTSIMHSDERRVADIPPPRDATRELGSDGNQAILRRVERREAQNPLQFFERALR
jgi:murein L,D-transpeptidase YcbB/YkuD